MHSDSPFERPCTQGGVRGPAEIASDEMARTALEMPEIFLASRTKNSAEVASVLQLGRIGERLDATLLSLRLYWTRHGNAAVRTWEDVIRTQGADLLSAIPLMAHALCSSDRDLQLLYCSLLECQRDLQRTSDAVQAHVQLNISIAREVSGHPGCQDLVKGKVLLAWCEGMLAERARMIASTCGLHQFPPFIQALHSLAADPCLPLPPLARTNASPLTATAAPPQLHRAQHSSLTLTAQQIAPPMHAAAQPHASPAGTGGAIIEINPHSSSSSAAIGHGRVSHPVQLANAGGGVHQGPYPPETGRTYAWPQPIPGHPLAASVVSPRSNADLHSGGQPVPPRGVGASPLQSVLLQQQSLVLSCPLPVMSLVQHSRQSMPEQWPEHEGPSPAAASISTAQVQGVAAGPSGLQLETRAAQAGPHESQGLEQRLISSGVDIGELSLRGHEDSQIAPAAAGQQLGAQVVAHHGAWSARDVTLPMEAGSAMPASTAGVLQSGSSEELANALAGLTQMVSTARGIPRPGHHREEPATRDAPAASQQTPISQNRAPQPHIEQPTADSQAADPVRHMDQDAAGITQVEEGSLSRPFKRARLAPEPELSTGVDLPGGHISEPAQLVTGLHPCGISRSSASYISQLQQQPAGAYATPEPTAYEDRHGNPSDGAHAARALASAEGPAAASLRLQVLEHKGGQSQANQEPEAAAAEGQPGDADIEGSLSAGAIGASNKELRAILRGDAAPSTSTEKSSMHSHQRSVHGAQVSCPEPSPTKDSAQHRASFAFAQPEAGQLRGTLEQLTPALLARAACPEAQPAARRGPSGDVVPDSAEHTTPLDQDGRGSQPRESVPALECSAQHSFRVADVDKLAGSYLRDPHTEQARGGAGAGGCKALLTGAAEYAMGSSPLSTPRGTQLGASNGPGICPGADSAERERARAQAATLPAAAAAALLESQRGSNSPNKRKLPQPRRPQDCGTSSGSGSPASQAPSSHSRGSSGKDLACLAAASSQRGGSSQPSPLCPTRLGQHRLADGSSQPDPSPVGTPALHLPQSQAACEGVSATTGMATCGSQPCAEAAGCDAGMDAARLETAVRLKWLRAVRVLHRMACRWQVPPAQQTWSSDVRVPISRDSSADASYQRPSDAAHNSGSRSDDAGAPQQITGHALVLPLGSCKAGEAAGDAAPSGIHSAELASSDWRTAWSHGSGTMNHADGQSLEGRCREAPAQVSEKRCRDPPVDGELSQMPPSAERACSHDDSAGQLAADGRHQKKRQRTEEDWSAGGSHRAAPCGQVAVMRQVLGSQPAGAMDAEEEAGARIGTAQPADLHGCAPAAMEADSDVDIGGPDDLGQTSASGSIAPGDHPLTQFPTQSGSTQGRAPSQAPGTQMGLMHSSEEQDPPCGQPVPPPHLSLGDRAEDYGRTPAALLLKRPMERSPWATPHFSHPHTAEHGHPDAPCSQRPAAIHSMAGPSAAGASVQNATMRVLSLEGRPSPGWTPGLMCSGTGAATAMPQRGDTGGAVPDALHRLARGAPLVGPTGGLSLQQGSCQAPLMTQSERPDHSEAGPRLQLGGPGLQGQQGIGELQHFETCRSLDGLLCGASQNSDRSLPLSQPAQPLP